MQRHDCLARPVQFADKRYILKSIMGHYFGHVVSRLSHVSAGLRRRAFYWAHGQTKPSNSTNRYPRPTLMCYGELSWPALCSDLNKARTPQKFRSTYILPVSRAEQHHNP